MTPAAYGLTTTTTALQQLGLGHPKAVNKLIDTGWIRVVGTHGRTRLLDPADVAALAKLPFLPAPTTNTVTAIAVSTGGMAPDTNPDNGRPYAGWLHPRVTNRPAISEADRVKAFSAWWPTGEELANELLGLPLVQVASSIIGEVQTIKAAHPHPVTPGLFWFETVPTSAATANRYLGHRVAFGQGPIWQRLYV